MVHFDVIEGFWDDIIEEKTIWFELWLCCFVGSQKQFLFLLHLLSNFLTRAGFSEGFPFLKIDLEEGLNLAIEHINEVMTLDQSHFDNSRMNLEPHLFLKDIDALQRQTLWWPLYEIKDDFLFMEEVHPPRLDVHLWVENRLLVLWLPNDTEAHLDGHVCFWW